MKLFGLQLGGTGAAGQAASGRGTAGDAQLSAVFSALLARLGASTPQESGIETVGRVSLALEDGEPLPPELLAELASRLEELEVRASGLRVAVESAQVADGAGDEPSAAEVEVAPTAPVAPGIASVSSPAVTGSDTVVAPSQTVASPDPQSGVTDAAEQAVQADGPAVPVPQAEIVPPTQIPGAAQALSPAPAPAQSAGPVPETATAAPTAEVPETAQPRQVAPVSAQTPPVAPTPATPSPSAVDPDPVPQAATEAGEADVLRDVPRRLVAVLTAFDREFGTNTRAVLSQGTGLAETYAQPAGAAEIAPKDIVALARRLLTGETVQPGQPVATPKADDGKPATAPDRIPERVALLIERALAAPEAKSFDRLPQELRTPLPVQDVLPSRTPELPAPSTPAKAAPAPAPSGFAASLANQVKGVQVSEGTTRIDLHPRGLGALEIDLAHGETGLKVTVRAENATVLAALRDNRDVLAAVLRDANVAVQGQSLGFESFGHGRGQQAKPDELGPTLAADAPQEDEQPAESASSRQTLAEGQVDIVT